MLVDARSVSIDCSAMSENMGLIYVNWLGLAVVGSFESSGADILI